MSHVAPLDPKNMDVGAGAGVDFFRFANGGWLDANPVPPEYGSWGSFREVQVGNEILLRRLLDEAASDVRDRASSDIAGRYFASGLDTDTIDAAGIDPLRPWLSRIEAVDSVDDLRSLAVELHPYGVRMLFGWYVAPDFEDSDRYLLYLLQGGLGLPDRDYYLRKDDRSIELRNLYRAHISTQLQNLGDGEDEAGRQGAAILDLETALAAPSYTAAQRRDVDLTTNKVARRDLAAVMLRFDLVAYLDGIEATGAASVNLENPGFFTELDRILHETPIEVWRAYARWHLIRATASALPAAFEDESFSFYGKALAGEQRQKKRWRRVLAAATGEIGESVSRLYVDAAFSAEAKIRCEQMVDGLVTAMGESIRTLDWMSDETKVEALAKLDGFTYKIGYPDRWKGSEGLEIDRAAWVVNRLRSRAFESAREIAKLDDPVDETEWGMPAHVVNAYYHPIRNEVVFPAGILQPPFFYADADDAVNYGAIGAVIGHEITHGFDDQGSRFDAAGHLRNWWSDADRAEFERRADVVVDQFDSYVVAEDMTINGRLTLGENIADLGGMKLAFNALARILDGDQRPSIDGYTSEQRFFLSFGTIWRQNYTEEYLRLLVNTDPHSPSRFRCNGTLANLDAFAEAFDLDSETPMMHPRDERAEIW